MEKAIASLFVSAVLFAPSVVRADPFTVSTSVSTAGTFSCGAYSTCVVGAGGSSITIPGGTGSATISFTGVTTTFEATNSLTTLEIGRFSVAADDGFVFPVNTANPELPIFRFDLLATNPTNGAFASRLMWFFGPGGGSTLSQFGPWDFSVPLDGDASPYTGINFFTSSPVLAINSTTSLTAEVGLVPEPSTLLLIGTGLAGAVLRRRRAAAHATRPGVASTSSR